MELKFITQNICSGCEALQLYLDNKYPDLEFEKINIDEDRSAIEKYDLMGTPTLILWDDDEIEEVNRLVGYRPGVDSESVDLLIEQYVDQEAN